MTVCLMALAEEAQYSIEEIEGFISKKAWAEAMLHLPTVPESERGKKWVPFVEKVAVGYLKSVAAESAANAMAIVDSLPQEYPVLRSSRVFHDAVEAIAYTGFSDCFADRGNEAECSKNLKVFVESHMESHERPFSRFCKDPKMAKALAGLCLAGKANPKGERP